MVAFFFLQNSDHMLVPLLGLFPPELSPSFPYCLHVPVVVYMSVSSIRFELSKSRAMFVFLCTLPVLHSAFCLVPWVW